MKTWKCEDGTVFTERDIVAPLGWRYTKKFLFIQYEPKHYVTIGGKERFIDTKSFCEYLDSLSGKGGTGIFA